MQENNSKFSFNKVLIIDFLTASIIIMLVLYVIYTKISNSTSSKNFLQTKNDFDKISKMQEEKVNFEDINNKVEKLFSQKDNISKEVIFSGTNGRNNPFSVINK